MMQMGFSSSCVEGGGEGVVIKWSYFSAVGESEFFQSLVNQYPELFF